MRRHIALEKELPSDNPYKKVDGDSFSYWKYCDNGIEKMIEEIKDYIHVIKEIK